MPEELHCAELHPNVMIGDMVGMRHEEYVTQLALSLRAVKYLDARQHLEHSPGAKLRLTDRDHCIADPQSQHAVHRLSSAR
jgi:hypothetical protein